MPPEKKKEKEYYVYPDGSVTHSPLELEGHPVLIRYFYPGNSKDSISVSIDPSADAAMLERIVQANMIDKEARTVIERMLAEGRIESGNYSTCKKPHSPDETT